jgi:MFS family permease
MAGMSLLVPVTMWLILTVGWRAAYAVIGLSAAIVLLPLALWVIRESPESMGFGPDGLAAESSEGDTQIAERTSVGDAVRTAPFWQLCGGLFTCGFSMSLLSAHGVPMLTDHGYHAMLASSAIGVLGAASFAGALILGTIADRFGRRPVLAWLYGTRALLFGAMFLVHDRPTWLLVISVLGGASMSGSLAMTSALTADIFGRFSVGSIFGMIFVVHQGGAALGASLGGILFEVTGGYGAAFAIASVQLLLAAAVSLTIDDQTRCVPALRPIPAER